MNCIQTESLNFLETGRDGALENRTGDDGKNWRREGEWAVVVATSWRIGGQIIDVK